MELIPTQAFLTLRQEQEFSKISLENRLKRKTIKRCRPPCWEEFACVEVGRAKRCCGSKLAQKVKSCPKSRQRGWKNNCQSIEHFSLLKKLIHSNLVLVMLQGKKSLRSRVMQPEWLFDQSAASRQRREDSQESLPGTARWSWWTSLRPNLTRSWTGRSTPSWSQPSWSSR